MLKYSDIPDAKKLEVKKYIGEIGSEHISRVVVEKVKEKFNVIIDERSVRYILQRIRASLDEVGETLGKAIEELNKDDKKKYEIVSNDKNELCYQMNVRNNIFTIPVAQIDKIFHMFSEHGDDMSAQEVQTEFNLSPQAWIAIKGKLNLYKTSHVISPYTLEHSSEKEVDRIIESATESHIDSYRRKFINTHERQFKAEAKKAMKTVANFQYQLDMIQEAIAIHEPVALDFVPEKVEGDLEAHFVISDIHFGKTDTEGVIRRMNQIYQEIVANPARIIHITCLGDLVETIAQGGMHPNQLDEGMDRTFGLGFEGVMQTVTIMEKWLTGLAKAGKTVYFKGLTGNHDRFTQNKEHDHRRTGGLVMYELLKRGLSQLDIDVQYFKEFIVTFVADDIEYIAIHGDGFIGKQAPEKIIIAHAKTDLYKVLLSGDKHTLQMSEGKGYTAIKCPATAGKGAYDTDMNLHSEAGYLQIRKNEYDTADVFIKRLR